MPGAAPPAAAAPAQAEAPAEPEPVEEEAPAGPPPEMMVYIRMCKVGVPPPAVKQKMSAEGMDPSELDKYI